MSHSPLRIVFAGTPDFSARHLEALLSPGLASSLEVSGVFTQPDRPAGRGKTLKPGPVKQLALEHDLPVFQPLTLKDPQAITALAALRPDVMVVVAYGLLLPQPVLDLPRFGCLNVHASLLPRWRGAAPIERAILEGDAETGVCIMQMEAGLDTGPVLARRATTINDQDNALTVMERLVELGREALVATLLELGTGSLHPEPQEDFGVTYAAKLTKQDAAIDWHRTVHQVQRQIQAFYPRSPAWTMMGGERLMILQSEPVHGPTTTAAPGTLVASDKRGLVIACADGCLRAVRLQVAGKKPVSAAELLNGRGDIYRTGAHFSSPGESG